jgi:aldose 1-epimerase
MILVIMHDMKKAIEIGLLLFLFSLTAPAKSERSGPPFAAHQISVDGVPVVRLTDSVRGIEVSILPSIGNMAYEMKIHGENILFFPEMKLADFQKRPMQSGIPFMGPWANRIDDVGFWANDKKYDFNLSLGNVFRDGAGLPIHGLLSNSALWHVTDLGADGQSAYVTSKLDFWKYPDLMAQWPFAHEYEMTYRLSNEALEVKTIVSNLSKEAMPLVIGFHPYYRIPGIPRDQWLLHLPARKTVIADDRHIPSGELKNMDLPNPLPLKGRTLDDGFTDLIRGEDGRALFSIDAGGKQIELFFGREFPVAVIWLPAAPPGKALDFVCVEPMAGVTNAMNLYHAGKYPELQTVPAEGAWSGSFWIRAEGF